jgi:hypothetical protein
LGRRLFILLDQASLFAGVPVPKTILKRSSAAIRFDPAAAMDEGALGLLPIVYLESEQICTMLKPEEPILDLRAASRQETIAGMPRVDPESDNPRAWNALA